MANIKFGTDGWRAVVGENFNEENVGIVSDAIGKYVFDNFGLGKTIIIGYDPRNMADKFSMQCAEILKNKGFRVLYSEKVVPTPVLAYSAKSKNACAVMFTASHNPPEYLGIKFIPDYAGPATSEITDELVTNFGKVLPNIDGGEIEKVDFSKEYFEHIKSIIDFKKIKELDKNIVFDGLYSATIGYFDTLLNNEGVSFETLHMVHDVNFGGGMPEPKPKFLKELISKVKSQKNAIGFANDGDGDRFGVIAENGEYISPNEVIAILLIHLKKNKGYSGSLVKTVGASLLLDKVAEKLGVEVIETPVGFKYVGEAMRKFNPIIAGEDSGGLSIQGHIPEKDGILANLLILETMAYQNKSLLELQNELYDFVGQKFYTDRIDLKLSTGDMIKKILDIISGITEINGIKVTRVKTIDGVKLIFEDESSILTRASGTEPLLRIYFEADSVNKIKEFQNGLEKFYKKVIL